MGEAGYEPSPSMASEYSEYVCKVEPEHKPEPESKHKAKLGLYYKYTMNHFGNGLISPSLGTVYPVDATKHDNHRVIVGWR